MRSSRVQRLLEHVRSYEEKDDAAWRERERFHAGSRQFARDLAKAS
jgi:hypothetical protein